MALATLLSRRGTHLYHQLSTRTPFSSQHPEWLVCPGLSDMELEMLRVPQAIREAFGELAVLDLHPWMARGLVNRANSGHVLLENSERGFCG